LLVAGCGSDQASLDQVLATIPEPSTESEPPVSDRPDVTAETTGPSVPVKQVGHDPDRITFESLEQLLGEVSFVATGRITGLDPGVPFYNEAFPDTISLVGTPTHVQLDVVAFDRVGLDASQSVTVLQAGGTYGGEEHWYVNEPVLGVGTHVLLFAVPYNAPVKGAAEYEAYVAAAIDSSGRLVPAAWRVSAPFLLDRTAADVLDDVDLLRDTPRATFPPSTPPDP
jgi:hypothetical protein